MLLLAGVVGRGLGVRVAVGVGLDSSTGSALMILPTSISSSAIESGLRDTDVTCGGTILPRPSPSWL